MRPATSPGASGSGRSHAIETAVRELRAADLWPVLRVQSRFVARSCPRQTKRTSNFCQPLYKKCGAWMPASRSGVSLVWNKARYGERLRVAQTTTVRDRFSGTIGVAEDKCFRFLDVFLKSQLHRGIEVADRNHANTLPTLGHGQVPIFAALHEFEGVAGEIIG